MRSRKERHGYIQIGTPTTNQPSKAYADAKVKEEAAKKPNNAPEVTVARAALEPPGEEAVSVDAVCLIPLGMESSVEVRQAKTQGMQTEDVPMKSFPHFA